MKRLFIMILAAAALAAFVGCGGDPTTSPERQVGFGSLSTSYAPAETLQVPADGSPVSSGLVLESGKTYKIRVSGTLVNGGPGDGLADAEYANFSVPADSVLDSCGPDTARVDLGLAIGDLVADSLKTPHWGAFDSTHVYVLDWAGADSAITFNFHDCDYSDNSGSLTVEIWAPFEFTIDIKPGSMKNPVNVGSRGVIPVAILGNEDFDVMDVDVSSLTFGPGEAHEAHGKGHPEDVNDDGIMDLMLHFRTQECGVLDGDTELCLHGMTQDGIALHDCDSITTVPE